MYSSKERIFMISCSRKNGGALYTDNFLERLKIMHFNDRLRYSEIYFIFFYFEWVKIHVIKKNQDLHYTWNQFIHAIIRYLNLGSLGNYMGVRRLSIWMSYDTARSY